MKHALLLKTAFIVFVASLLVSWLICDWGVYGKNVVERTIKNNDKVTYGEYKTEEYKTTDHIRGLKYAYRIIVFSIFGAIGSTCATLLFATTKPLEEPKKKHEMSSIPVPILEKHDVSKPSEYKSFLNMTQVHALKETFYILLDVEDKGLNKKYDEIRPAFGKSLKLYIKKGEEKVQIRKEKRKERIRKTMMDKRDKAIESVNLDNKRLENERKKIEEDLDLMMKKNDVDEIKRLRKQVEDIKSHMNKEAEIPEPDKVMAMKRRKEYDLACNIVNELSSFNKSILNVLFKVNFKIAAYNTVEDSYDLLYLAFCSYLLSIKDGFPHLVHNSDDDMRVISLVILTLLVHTWFITLLYEGGYDKYKESTIRSILVSQQESRKGVIECTLLETLNNVSGKLFDAKIKDIYSLDQNIGLLLVPDGSNTYDEYEKSIKSVPGNIESIKHIIKMQDTQDQHKNAKIKEILVSELSKRLGYVFAYNPL